MRNLSFTKSRWCVYNLKDFLHNNEAWKATALNVHKTFGFMNLSQIPCEHQCRQRIIVMNGQSSNRVANRVATFLRSSFSLLNCTSFCFYMWDCWHRQYSAKTQTMLNIWNSERSECINVWTLVECIEVWKLYNTIQLYTANDSALKRQLIRLISNVRFLIRAFESSGSESLQRFDKVHWILKTTRSRYKYKYKTTRYKYFLT